MSDKIQRVSARLNISSGQRTFLSLLKWSTHFVSLFVCLFVRLFAWKNRCIENKYDRDLRGLSNTT